MRVNKVHFEKGRPEMSFLRRSALALSFLAGALVSQTMHAAEQPNIVMIISDDQAWTDYGFLDRKSVV